MTRSDLRTSIRDYLYESTADLWLDAQLNRWIDQEMRAMPRKGVYSEEIYSTTQVVDQLDYALPTGTYKTELVEINTGTTDKPYWIEAKGWDNYGGALWFKSRPTYAYPMRVHVRKSFTILTDDVTATDVPDPETEVLIFGVAKRAYKAILGYFVDSRNWDTIAKPDGVSLNQISNLYQQSKLDYDDSIKTYRKYPRPRDIDMTG